MKNKLSRITASIILGTTLMYTLPVSAFTKDETVYSNLNSKGQKYQTIVTTHLINENDEKILKDLTTLLNIENTSGNENFKKEGEELIWEANSNDIYYKGETNKSLPIDIKITYVLDGKEIEPEKIAGKDGKVKITIQLENKEIKEVEINGKKEKMYIPFTVACGTSISNEKNKNIEVKNAKIIDDGSKTMVAGITFPGLKESLKTDAIEIPETIEIEMDSKEFEMNNIIMYAMPINTEELDLDIFSKIDELYTKVEDLKTASNQIEEGAKTLSEGIQTANTGANQIQAEVGKAINNLKVDNSNALDEATLAMIEQQAAGGATLTQEQINMIIASADSGIDAQANYIKEQYIQNAKEIARATAIQSAVQAKLQTKEAVKQGAIAAAKAGNPSLDDATALAIGEQVASNINTDLTDAEKATIIAGADSGIEAQRSQIEAKGIASAKQIAEQTAVKTAQETAQTAAKATSRQIAIQVGNTVKREATKKVISQMTELNNGLNQLSNGLEQLDIGSTTLAEGTHEFNESGINAIYNYVNNNVKNISVRAEKIQELAENYTTFTKTSEENKGKVKFITIVDSLKKDEDTTSQEKTEEKTSK
ncbi:MAG: hypothetical protein HFJ44_05585 [Clostridia bacterium]|jgi:putative membrane protein|nr:hypothetical protein [Clostridia bacterium]